MDVCFAPSSAQIGEGVRGEGVRQIDAWGDERRVEGERRLDRCWTTSFAFTTNSIGIYWCNDRDPLILLLLVCKMSNLELGTCHGMNNTLNVPCEVLGCQIVYPRHAPNLQEMDLLIAVSFFAVANASTSGSKLDITTFEYLNISH